MVQYQKADSNGQISYAASAPKTISFNKSKPAFLLNRESDYSLKSSEIGWSNAPYFTNMRNRASLFLSFRLTTKFYADPDLLQLLIEHRDGYLDNSEV